MADVAAGVVLETTLASEQSLAGRGFSELAPIEGALANAPEKSIVMAPSRLISTVEILVFSMMFQRQRTFCAV